MQDFTLFVILGETRIDLWKQKVDWIAGRGGMALLNSHPDYMNFGSGACRAEEYPAAYYRAFLEFIKSRFNNRYWHALPSGVWDFWTSRVQPARVPSERAASCT